jgi:predicted ATPase
MPSTALDYITIKGFKSIASIEKLALKPINILIGANGSGKSNFIGVFDFLHEIREGRLRDYALKSGGAEKILHFGSKTTKEMYFGLSFANGKYHYELSLAPTAADGFYPSDESFKAGREGSRTRRLLAQNPGLEASISGDGHTRVTKWLRDQLDLLRPYHLHDPSAMRKTTKVDDNRFLRPDGGNLAALLYYLREKRDSYSLIVRTVQRVAPFFDDFRLAPLRRKPDDIKLEWRHKRSDQYFDASSLSDGTLRFIALATLFLQPKEDRPPVILVDEPELGLHPYAIGMLAALIRQAAVHSQVIVSTQSPLLLDYFKPEDVLVADLIDGGTELKRLKSSRLAKWLKDYSLGQLWEKNEFGGRPNSGRINDTPVDPR